MCTTRENKSPVELHLVRMKFLNCLIICLFGLLSLSFSKEFDNGNVIVDKPNSVAIGTSALFTCTLARSEQEVTDCFIETPRNEVWMVIDGQVLDDQSNVVQGVFGLDNGEPLRTCGIAIDVVQSTDLGLYLLHYFEEQYNTVLSNLTGQWKCKIQRSGSKIPTLKAVVELKEEGTKLTGYRLPSHVTAELYKLDLIPIMYPEFLTQGYFEIDGRVYIDQLDGHLYLNVYNTEMLEESLIITLGPQISATMEILEIHYDFERDLIIIKYVPYAADASYPIRVAGNFVSKLPYPSGSGFYTDSYKNFETGDRVYVAATQFQAVHARKAFPSIDDPGRKAPFQVRIAAESGKTAASNMPVLKTDEPVEGYPGYTWYEFPQSPIMSSYTLAFFVSDFAKATVSPFEVNYPIEIFARESRFNLGYTKKAEVYVPGIMEFYESYHLVEFPLPKLSVAAPPSKGGAMENWGMLLMADFEFILDEEYMGAKDWEDSIPVLAHELAHQWSGNLVTCDYWDEIYLNEGLTEFFQYYGAEAVVPELRNWDRFVRTETFLGLREGEDRISSHPIIQEPDVEPNSYAFDGTTYRKGSSLFRMIEAVLGKNTFQKGLQNYMKAHQFGNTKSDDLWDMLDSAASEDGSLSGGVTVKEVMHTWTLQRGHPIINVDTDFGSGLVTLRQTELPMDVGKNYKWWVPITYGRNKPGSGNFDQTKNSIWLSPEDASVRINIGSDDGSCFILNNQYTGLFRVKYTDENWLRISNFLKNDMDAIPPPNRAQIIHDSIFLAQEGLLDYNIPLQIITYLNQETEYAPFQTAVALLENIMLKSVRTRDETQLIESMHNSLKQKYNEIGLEEQGNADLLDHLQHRAMIQALINYGDFEVLQDVQFAFQAWMVSPNPDEVSGNPINRHIRSPIYCSALQQGGLAELTFIEDRMANTVSPQATRDLNRALGCAALRSDDALEQFLEDPLNRVTLGSTLESSQQEFIFKDKKTRNILMKWVLRHLDDIETFNGDIFRQTLKLYADFADTQEELNHLQEMMNWDAAPSIEVLKTIATKVQYRMSV